jgi:hypothetical protein
VLQQVQTQLLWHLCVACSIINGLCTSNYRYYFSKSNHASAAGREYSKEEEHPRARKGVRAEDNLLPTWIKRRKRRSVF